MSDQNGENPGSDDYRTTAGNGWARTESNSRAGQQSEMDRGSLKKLARQSAAQNESLIAGNQEKRRHSAAQESNPARRSLAKQATSPAPSSKEPSRRRGTKLASPDKTKKTNTTKERKKAEIGSPGRQ